MKEFDSALAEWIEKCQEMVVSHYKEHFPTLTPSVLNIEGGRKYIKIAVTRKLASGGNGQKSVFAFIEKATGNVLKPASWAAPAKHARGNLYDETGGMGMMGPYGPAYLK